MNLTKEQCEALYQQASEHYMGDCACSELPCPLHDFCAAVLWALEDLAETKGQLKRERTGKRPP